MSNTVLLRPNSAARRIGVCAARVRQLDDVLHPLLTEDGARLYRADAVEGYANRRQAAKDKR